MMNHHSSLMEINIQGNILIKETLVNITEKTNKWLYIGRILKSYKRKKWREKTKMKITYITKSNSTTISNRNKKIAGRGDRALCKEVKSPCVNPLKQ